MMRSLVAVFVALLVILGGKALASGPQTFVLLESEPGYVEGPGFTQLITPATASFELNGGSQGIYLSLLGDGYDSLNFSVPSSGLFAIGSYDNALSGVTGSPDTPLIGVSINDTCFPGVGRFTVLDLAYGPNFSIDRLAIDFEQQCVGGGPALFGSIRYRSAVPATPQISVGNIEVRKPNTGSTSAVFNVALSRPINQDVSVAFETVDGPGTAGKDYVKTTGRVRIPAGRVSVPVRVPVLGDRLERGDKTFGLRLSASTGAPIGIATASAYIEDGNGPIALFAADSQPGDFIGKGQTYSLSGRDRPFTGGAGDNSASFSLGDPEDWNLTFAAPSGKTLKAGQYLNAEQYNFRTSSVPTMNITGNGSSCDSITGQFTITQIDPNPGTDQNHFLAEFVQHCGGVPALLGTVAYNTKVRQFSVSDALIKGSVAQFVVTQNPASTTAQTVTFQTTDVTAIGNYDYTPITTTLVFQPGEVAKRVDVRLLHPTATNLEFAAQLSGAGTTPIWVGRALADF